MATAMVEISVETYRRLIVSEEILDALNAYGVDNWDGYEAALESLEE